ncbi:hypothetical protein V5O48_001765 [Marasmius crinis-equi]|uniref:Uncharacterized protein n=1 Tax=Marasmius crinis-equi TaxID=585013 RepID=A0ABR3FXM2_9AGAR
MSFFAYRQYYPPLHSEMSHKPFSPRIKREMEAILPIHHHDRDSSRSETPMTQPVRPSGMTRRYTDEPEGFELSSTANGKRPEREHAGWRDTAESDERDAVAGGSGLR